MKGIARRIDDLGRITIPIEIRRRFGIEDGDRLGIEIDKNIVKLSVVVKGMSRPIDDLGRVVIPMEIRKVLKFKERELVDTWVEDGKICIRKAVLQCVICGSEDERQLMEVDGVLICKSCGLKVVDKFMEG